MTTKSTAANVMRGSCTCGANTFEVKAGVPMQRFYCHCLYCQQFMGKLSTDVTFVRAKNVVINREHATFNNPKLLPPGFAHGRGSRFGNPDRGRFAKCASPTAAGATTAGSRSSRPSGDPPEWCSSRAATSSARTSCRPCSGTSLPAARAGRRRRATQAPLLRQQPASDRREDQPGRVLAPRQAVPKATRRRRCAAGLGGAGEATSPPGSRSALIAWRHS